MKNALILVGGGGHCKSCIDVIEAEGNYIIEGIIDTPDKIGSQILNYSVIADDYGIDEFVSKGYYFLVTVGQIKSVQIRRKLYLLLKNKGAKLPTIIDPSAKVSRYANIGEGSIVMHGVFVNAGAYVGNNVILNTNCLIEHDVVIRDHVHISTHAIVNGSALVEENCFIGSNCVVAQGVEITKDVVVGAGAVVTANISTRGIYAGNPAKQLNK